MVFSAREKPRFPRWVNPEFNLREVYPELFVGDLNSPLQSREWGLVVDLCGALRTEPMGRRRYPANAELISVRLEDGQPIPDAVFDKVYDRVRLALLAGEKVLIHCAAGMSRSVSMAYAVLRVGRKMSHEEALSFVTTEEGVRMGWPMRETLGSAKRWAEEKA
jgi:hypothetical protein